MAMVPVPIFDILNDPRLSITSSPFAPGKMIIKRASFIGGETPAHLSKFAITKGMCSGTGTVVYHGKKIPTVAACVGHKRG
jgi:hypothetical protein